jgi:hypothetical protein
MAIYPIEKLSSGMRTSAAVSDHHGRILLNSGVILQEEHFRILKMRGIRNVAVEVPTDGVPDENNPLLPSSDLPAEVQARVDDLYRNTKPSDPVMAVLRYWTAVSLMKRQGGR